MFYKEKNGKFCGSAQIHFCAKAPIRIECHYSLLADVTGKVKKSIYAEKTSGILNVNYSCFNIILVIPIIYGYFLIFIFYSRFKLKLVFELKSF